MKKILLFLVLTTFNIALSQSLEWIWAKNSSVYISGKNNMTAVDADGNVYLVGDFNTATAQMGNITLTNNSEAGHSDAYIFKFNYAGILLWHKQISTNKTESITAVATDNLGNAYIIGSVGNTITLGSSTLSTGGNPYFVAKLDSNGVFVWAIQSGNSDFYYLNDIKVDSLGNVFVSGAFRYASLTFGNVFLSIDPQHATLANTRPFVLKFNSNGVAQWGKMGTSVEANVFGTIPNSMAVDNSGGVVLCGKFHHNSLTFGAFTVTKGTQNNNSNDMFIVKYDAAGNEVFAHSAGSVIMPNNTTAEAVTTDLDNNIYVGGSFENLMQIGNESVIGASGAQYYLAKYNANGEYQWVKTPNMSNNYTGIKSLASDSSGNIYAAGLTYATSIGFSPSVLLSNLGTVGSLFVTKFNNSGTPIWARGVSNLDANNDISIDCKTENDLIIGGSFDTSSIQFGTTTLTKSSSSRDFFVARLYAAPLNTSDFQKEELVLYPNPVKNILHVSNLKSTYNYNLYNLLGRRVQIGTLNQADEQINVASLTSGFYILELTDKFGQSFQRKIMVE